METLTHHEKLSWIESSPTKVFDLDPKTDQVSSYTAQIDIRFFFLIWVNKSHLIVRSRSLNI